MHAVLPRFLASVGRTRFVGVLHYGLVTMFPISHKSTRQEICPLNAAIITSLTLIGGETFMHTTQSIWSNHAHSLFGSLDPEIEAENLIITGNSQGRYEHIRMVKSVRRMVR